MFTYKFKEFFLIVKKYISIIIKIDILVYAVVFLKKSKNRIFQVISLVIGTNTCFKEHTVIKDILYVCTIHCDRMWESWGNNHIKEESRLLLFK